MHRYTTNQITIPWSNGIPDLRHDGDVGNAGCGTCDTGGPAAPDAPDAPGLADERPRRRPKRPWGVASMSMGGKTLGQVGKP